MENTKENNVYEYGKSFRNGWYLKSTFDDDYKLFPTDISLTIYAEEHDIQLVRGVDNKY